MPINTLKVFFEKAGTLPGSLVIEIDGHGALLRDQEGRVSPFTGAFDEPDCYWRITENALFDIVEGRRTGFDVFMRGEGMPSGNMAVLRSFELLWHGADESRGLTELDHYKAPSTEKAYEDVFMVETEPGIHIRCAVWVPKGEVKGSILFFNGRREFIEKYFEVYHRFIDQGYAVATLDWRGQGLSSREADHPHKGYIRNFADFQNDLEIVWGQYFKKELKGPIYVMGHSMGGHNAIRFVHAHQEELAGAILCSPMVKINASGPLTLVMKALVNFNHLFNKSKSWLPAQGPLDVEVETFEGNGLSHDPVRWSFQQDLFRKNPDLSLGGATSGWLRAALKSIKNIHNQKFIDKLKCPLIVLSGAEDTTVDSEAAIAWAERCSNGKGVLIPQARHEIMCETDEIQVPFWQEVDQFLMKNK